MKLANKNKYASTQNRIFNLLHANPKLHPLHVLHSIYSNLLTEVVTVHLIPVLPDCQSLTIFTAINMRRSQIWNVCIASMWEIVLRSPTREFFLQSINEYQHLLLNQRLTKVKLKMCEHQSRRASTRWSYVRERNKTHWRTDSVLRRLAAKLEVTRSNTDVNLRVLYYEFLLRRAMSTSGENLSNCVPTNVISQLVLVSTNKRYWVGFFIITFKGVFFFWKDLGRVYSSSTFKIRVCLIKQLLKTTEIRGNCIKFKSLH